MKISEVTEQGVQSVRPASPQGPGEMHLFEHLAELRKCLIISFGSIGVFAVAAYSFSREAFAFLKHPFEAAFPQIELIGTGPAEIFMLKIKVACFMALILSLPIICYQIWSFIAPGLYEHEKKLVVPFVAVTSLLFFFGISFCYFAVLPIALRFFMNEYLSVGVSPAIRVNEYFSLVLETMLGFGLVFEMPVGAFILGRWGMITHRTLLGAGRYAVVGIFIVAAVLTPPDVLSQLLMAAPLLALYGISIVVVRLTGRERVIEPEEREAPRESNENFG